MKGTELRRTSAAELAALRECLPNEGRGPLHDLPRAVFKQLFQENFLQPDGPTAGEAHYWQDRLPALSLSPYLNLSLRFRDGARGPSALEPSIALFLRPEFVAWAEELAAEFNQALNFIARGMLVRGAALASERTQAWLRELVAKKLRRQPDLAQWLGGTPDYAQLYSPAPSFPLAQISLAGCGKAKLAVPLPVTELPALARVLTATGGPLPAQDLPMTVRRVLDAIARAGGFIARGQAPPSFPPQAGPDCALAVTHLGHACLIVDGGGRRVLVDPMLYPWQADFARQPLTAAQMGPVDAICFTHHHTDHLETSSLLTLPREVPVFVPVDGDSPLAPRLAGFLRLLGFTDVRPLARGASYELEGGLTIEAAPFYGEAQDRLGFGANCYLFSRQGQNVLAYADAAPDSQGRSLVSTGWLREAVRRRGPVKVVFGTWWQERELVCRLSPLAIFTPGISPADWLESTEMCDCPPEFVRDLAQAAEATHFFTYAESGPEGFLALSDMSLYVPGVSFYWQPWEEFSRQLQQSGVEMSEAQPFLTVRLASDGLVRPDWSGVEASRQPARPGNQ